MTEVINKKYSISAFFPAYNEEKNIEKTISAAREVLEKLTKVYEIIIIDDGSGDRTADLVKRLSRASSQIKLVQHENNQGYGKTLQSGFKAARYELIFFSDADCQFDLTELSKFLAEIENCDVVIGYRCNRQDSWIRKLNGLAWNWLVNLLFGLDIKDAHCAFKLFRRSALERIPYKSLFSRGAMISAELLVYLKRAGLEINQLPVTHFPRRFGTSSGGDLKVIIRAFKELFFLSRTIHKLD